CIQHPSALLRSALGLTGLASRTSWEDHRVRLHHLGADYLSAGLLRAKVNCNKPNNSFPRGVLCGVARTRPTLGAIPRTRPKTL
ncbi:hypothetical protein LA080_008596, partial [Diaporthe eres]